MALPQPPEDLCFSTGALIEKEFNVDEFVSAIRKRVTVECLREDLDSYFRTLKNAMVELINKDYADFVALSANLVSSIQLERQKVCSRAVARRFQKFQIMHTITSHAYFSLVQVGMDKSISNLTTPLTQLQEEIMVTSVHVNMHSLCLNFKLCMQASYQVLPTVYKIHYTCTTGY